MVFHRSLVVQLFLVSTVFFPSNVRPHFHGRFAIRYKGWLVRYRGIYDMHDFTLWRLWSVRPQTFFAPHRDEQLFATRLIFQGTCQIVGNFLQTGAGDERYTRRSRYVLVISQIYTHIDIYVEIIWSSKSTLQM